MNAIARWHAWMKAHSAYFWGTLAIFPEVWVMSPDLQALLPAVLVSRIASVAAVVGFVLKVRAKLKAAKLDDPTDHAGA